MAVVVFKEKIATEQNQQVRVRSSGQNGDGDCGKKKSGWAQAQAGEGMGALMNQWVSKIEDEKGKKSKRLHTT